MVSNKSHNSFIRAEVPVGCQNIKLAWPGNSVEEKDEQKRSLASAARRFWARNFTNITYQENNIISLEGIKGFTVSLRIYDLCKILQEVEFNRFSQYLPPNPALAAELIEPLTQLYQVRP